MLVGLRRGVHPGLAQRQPGDLQEPAGHPRDPHLGARLQHPLPFGRKGAGVHGPGGLGQCPERQQQHGQRIRDTRLQVAYGFGNTHFSVVPIWVSLMNCCNFRRGGFVFIKIPLVFNEEEFRPYWL